MYKFIAEVLQNQSFPLVSSSSSSSSSSLPVLLCSLSFYWNSNGDSERTRKNNGRAWKPQNRFALGARVMNDDIMPATWPKKGPGSCLRFILILHVIRCIFPRLPLRDHVFLRVCPVSTVTPTNQKDRNCKSTGWDRLEPHRVVDGVCEMSGCRCRLQLRS